MGENRGHLLPCTQHRCLAILHARRDLLGMQGKWELRWWEMHPFVVEKRQHLTQERHMHKKVMHVVTISTEFITKIHIFVSAITILCALWGCSQEETLLVLKTDLCTVPRWGSLETRRGIGEHLCSLHGTTHWWCPLLPWAPMCLFQWKDRSRSFLHMNNLTCWDPSFLEDKLPPKNIFIHWGQTKCGYL